MKRLWNWIFNPDLELRAIQVVGDYCLVERIYRGKRKLEIWKKVS